MRRSLSAAVPTVLLTLAGVVTLATVAAVCTSGGAVELPYPSADADADADAGPAGVPVGAPIVVVTDSATLTYTLTTTELHRTDTAGEAAGRGMWLLARVSVMGVRGRAAVCDCDMSYVDAQGRAYPPAAAGFPRHPALPALDLAAGDGVAGWVVFDVPAAAGGRVELRAPPPYRGPYGWWTLDR